MATPLTLEALPVKKIPHYPSAISSDSNSCFCFVHLYNFWPGGSKIKNWNAAFSLKESGNSRNVPSGRPSHSLARRRNLNLASNVCETAARSLFDPSATELNELLEVRFHFPFNLIGKLITAFFNRLIMAPTQILVRRWWPQNKDLSLTRKRI